MGVNEGAWSAVGVATLSPEGSDWLIGVSEEDLALVGGLATGWSGVCPAKAGGTEVSKDEGGWEEGTILERRLLALPDDGGGSKEGPGSDDDFMSFGIPFTSLGATFNSAGDDLVLGSGSRSGWLAGIGTGSPTFGPSP